MVNSPLIRRIDKVSNWLLALIVGIPFLISAGALKALAEQQGMAWPILYPFMIDGGLIIFKALALRASLYGQRDGYAWGMAGVLTILSVVLNVLHVTVESETAEPAALAGFMAGLPPLVIFAAFVAVGRRIEGDMQREMDSAHHQQLGRLIAEKEAMLTALTEQVQAVERQRSGSEFGVMNDVNPNGNGRSETIGPNGKRSEGERSIIREANSERSENERSAVQKMNGRRSKNERSTESKMNGKRSGNKHNPIRKVNDGRSEGERSIVPKEDVLDEVLAFVARHPKASYAEIGAAVGRQKSTVSGYMSQLKRQGRLRRDGDHWQTFIK